MSKRVLGSNCVIILYWVGDSTYLDFYKHIQTWELALGLHMITFTCIKFRVSHEILCDTWLVFKVLGLNWNENSWFWNKKLNKNPTWLLYPPNISTNECYPVFLFWIIVKKNFILVFFSLNFQCRFEDGFLDLLKLSKKLELSSC
jgi:hypothetical protein